MVTGFGGGGLLPSSPSKPPTLEPAALCVAGLFLRRRERRNLRQRRKGAKEERKEDKGKEREEEGVLAFSFPPLLSLAFSLCVLASLREILLDNPPPSGTLLSLPAVQAARTEERRGW
jgi:hypothetical protein